MEQSYNWISELEFNLETVNLIKKSISETIEYNKIKSNTSGKSCIGNIEQYNLTNLIDNWILSSIKDLILKQLINSKILKDSSRLKETSAWTCVGESGSYHMVHNHNLVRGSLNSISSVIYLQCPEIKDIGGLFYCFFTNNEVIIKRPFVGKILTFPTWIFHGTYPQPDGTRQTLNLSFEII